MQDNERLRLFAFILFTNAYCVYQIYPTVRTHRQQTVETASAVGASATRIGTYIQAVNLSINHKCRGKVSSVDSRELRRNRVIFDRKHIKINSDIHS